MADPHPTPEVGKRPGGAPTVSLHQFGEALKRFREQRSVTQAAAASRVGVSRATFAQWETGRHLPTSNRVGQLDEFLAADGQLVDLASRARSPQRLRPVEPPELATDAPATETLLSVYSDVRTALLDQMCRDDDGRPTGWRHNLVSSDEAPTVLSTAYALKTLALLGGPRGDTNALVNALLRRADRDGDRIIGWRARSQVEARLETTAIVLDALLRVGAVISADEVVRVLRGLLDDTARERPFILTTALEPVLRVAPDSSLATELIKLLLACRTDFGGIPLWPEKLLKRNQPLLDPSVVHTARAATALRSAHDSDSHHAVEIAEEWIVGADDLNGVTEIIRRNAAHGREELAIEHFTSAWVVRALAGAARPDQGHIRRALGFVWARYDRALRLWAWGNGDVPAWMVHDAVAALHAAALALHVTPVHRET